MKIFAILAGLMAMAAAMPASPLSTLAPSPSPTLLSARRAEFERPKYTIPIASGSVLPTGSGFPTASGTASPTGFKKYARVNHHHHHHPSGTAVVAATGLPKGYYKHKLGGHHHAPTGSGSPKPTGTAS